MAPLFEFVGHYWWLVFPFAGVVGGAVKGIAAANERRAQRRLERYRIKQETKVALANAKAQGRVDSAANRRELVRVMAQHDEVDARWLSYEIDVAKLLDFPLMTDMRDPLTAGFHRARSRADLLRPADIDGPGGIRTDRAAQLEYRDAVHEYAAAFDVAEAEAIRRRRSDFSAEAQQRLARAQHLLRLATDGAATAQERQAAYTHAQKELDGLVVLPAAARAAVERRVMGEIEA